MSVYEIGAQRVLEYGEDDPLLGDVQAIMDLLGRAFAVEAGIVAIPASRLPADFFRLRTGFAGEIMQKFSTYRIRLMIFGDISEHVAASNALRDFVRETNRQGFHGFAKDRETYQAGLRDS